MTRVDVKSLHADCDPDFLTVQYLENISKGPDYINMCAQIRIP